MKFRILLLLVAGSAAAGCDSPEATRTRGGGPGGDVKNWSQPVKMHEGSQPYWRTPDRIELSHPSLDPAGHAQQTSRP